MYSSIPLSYAKQASRKALFPDTVTSRQDAVQVLMQLVTAQLALLRERSIDCTAQHNDHTTRANLTTAQERIQAVDTDWLRDNQQSLLRSLHLPRYTELELDPEQKTLARIEYRSKRELAKAAVQTLLAPPPHRAS